MAQWDNYSTKAAPADSDTMMIKDNEATGKPNKRVLFSGLWDWIVSKLANAVISSLTTNPKTVTGGMNALQTAVTTLNSKYTYSDINIGDVTIGTNGYYDLYDVMPKNKTIINANVSYFGGATGAVVVTANGRYLIGASGTTVTNLRIRFFFQS